MKTLDEIIREYVVEDNYISDNINHKCTTYVCGTPYRTTTIGSYVSEKTFDMSKCIYDFSMKYDPTYVYHGTGGEYIRSYNMCYPVPENDIEYIVIHHTGDNYGIYQYESALLDINYHMMWGSENLLSTFKSPILDYDRCNNNVTNRQISWRNIETTDTSPLLVPKNPMKNGSQTIKRIMLNRGHDYVYINENGSISCSSILAYEQYRNIITHVSKDMLNVLFEDVTSEMCLENLSFHIINKNDFIHFENSEEFSNSIKAIVDNLVNEIKTMIDKGEQHHEITDNTKK